MPRAEALAIAEGRVEAIGAREDIEPLASGGTKRIDLEGATVLPGFNDAHVHVWKLGQLLTSILDLRGVAGLEALGRALRERAAGLPDEPWIIGRGYKRGHHDRGTSADGQRPG